MGVVSGSGVDLKSKDKSNKESTNQSDRFFSRRFHLRGCAACGGACRAYLLVQLFAWSQLVAASLMRVG